jgi:hypothetical protein
MRNLLCIWLMFFPALALAAEVPAYVAQAVPEARMVGEGRMRYLLWDVYDARLYAPQGQYRDNASFALSLQYLRALDGEDIARRSVEEMRKQGFDNEVKLAAWFGEMHRIFPDVQAGDQLTGVYVPGQPTRFYSGTTLIGEVHDKDFGPWFFAIWLSSKTSAPDLRASLVGQHDKP